MKRWIHATTDADLLGDWLDGTEYEGDKTGLYQDVMNHWQKAFDRGTDAAWKAYHKWLDETAGKLNGAFASGRDLDRWAFSQTR